MSTKILYGDSKLAESIGTVTSATTLTQSDSGKVLFLKATAGAQITLPAPSAGFNVRIVTGQAFATTGIFFNPDSIASTISQVPTGSITMYGSSTPPTGFLNCDGSAVSRTTYANLFAVTSTTYGAGDGSTTFNLPDLKARFPLGYAASAPTKVFTFASRSSNTITVTSDVLTNSTTNELQTGQKVNFVSSGTTITGLTSGVDYYIVRVAYNQFQLATSVLNANKGTVITLSGDGTGTRTFTVTYSARAIADKGGTETATQVASHNHTTTDGGGSAAGGGSSGNSANVTGTTGNDAPNNMPLFTVVNYIIKT
jgi:microcystin-dependent protein